MTRGWVQPLAAVMAGVNAVAWVLSARWERRGRGIELSARVRPPAVVGRGTVLAQVAPLAYPFLVVVAPGWTYEGWSNWSTGVDVVLQPVGVGLWALGLALGMWAARTMGEYLAIGGVAVDHRLVTSGPYQHVRHPVYAAMMAIAVGTALVFRSHLLLGVAASSIAIHLWWVVAEEQLLGSPDGLGDAYRSYASGTGRLLPKSRRSRPPTPWS